jgi:ArsR family transcriptional regulator
MTIAALTSLVRMHKAIAHPVRLRLLAMLRGGPLCVCQMTVVVKLAASTVSEHLSELRRAALVVERKDGRWVEIRLAESPAAQAVLGTLWSQLDEDPDVRADAILLKELRRVPLEDLCGVKFQLSRLAKPKLRRAVTKAARIRATAEADR